MRSRKEYEKELRVQRALGTLGRYMVFCQSAKNAPNLKLKLRKSEFDQYFVSCEIPEAVNAEHAIDVVMDEYGFPKNARKYLSAKRM